MTSKDFRRIAMELPEAIEGRHMSHPDFRVRGKIFATLTRDETRGVVMLTPDQQSDFVASAPAVFAPVNGAWGRRGCTYVALRAAKAASVREAMRLAWRNKTPKSIDLP
jgi:hypothetical protein